jgi:hypothetical protein
MLRGPGRYLQQSSHGFQIKRNQRTDRTDPTAPRKDRVEVTNLEDCRSTPASSSILSQWCACSPIRAPARATVTEDMHPAHRVCRWTAPAHRIRHGRRSLGLARPRKEASWCWGTGIGDGAGAAVEMGVAAVAMGEETALGG